MASSSNQKSSSSASSSPKPTYRRAGRSSGTTTPQRAASPAPDQPRSKATSTKGTAVRGLRAKPDAVPARRAVGVSAARSKAPASVPASSPKTVRAGTAHTGARAGTVQKSAQKAGAPAARAAAPAARKGAAGAGSGASAGAPAAPAVRAKRAPAVRKGGAARAAGARLASIPQALKSVPAARGSHKERPSSPSSRAGGADASPRAPRPHAGRGVLIAVCALVLALVVAAAALLSSGFFDIENIEVNGGENVSQEMVAQLLVVPEGTTYFSVDEDAILSSLARSSWICGVEIERQFPDTLVITPVERTVALVVYINSDEVAWLVSDDGYWIAPASLTIVTDAEGTVIEADEDGSYPEDSVELSAAEAAAVVAAQYGALLVIDVPSDVSPSTGEEVDSEIVLAALAYAQGFSAEFLATIKNLSAASVEAIAANLTSGVEVALGEAEDIATKELVVTTLLEEQEGVTYINVREADAYTFRATPS